MDLAALPLHRKPRKATNMDRIRVREFVKLVRQGESEIDAFWHVASHQHYGFSRLRGKAERPAEIKLYRKLASLLRRAAPELLEDARDLATVRLSGLSDPAVQAVGEVVTGDFTDGSSARARLDAARVILGSLGVKDQAAAAAAQANVHVSLGDSLRAMRHVEAEVADGGSA